MWCILENILYAPEKNVYAIVVANVLYMSVRSDWFIVLCHLFPYLSSGCSIHCREQGIEDLTYYLWNCPLLPSIPSVFASYM